MLHSRLINKIFSIFNDLKKQLAEIEVVHVRSRVEAKRGITATLHDKLLSLQGHRKVEHNLAT